MKRSFFKSGYFIGLLLFIVGIIITGQSPNGGAAIGSIGIIVLVVTFFKRFLAKRKAKRETIVSSSIVSAPTVPEPVTPAYRTESHVVAGTTHHEDAIESIGTYNSDYDLSKKEFQEQFDAGDRVYQYEFICSDVRLVPEPENPKDSNAIQVIVDGAHIGYIKKGSTAHIKNLLEGDLIERIDAHIGGGKYKVLDDDGNIERDRLNYSARLTVSLRE